MILVNYTNISFPRLYAHWSPTFDAVLKEPTQFRYPSNPESRNETPTWMKTTMCGDWKDYDPTMVYPCNRVLAQSQ